MSASKQRQELERVVVDLVESLRLGEVMLDNFQPENQPMLYDKMYLLLRLEPSIRLYDLFLECESLCLLSPALPFVPPLFRFTSHYIIFLL